jgi:hypothetical protein
MIKLVYKSIDGHCVAFCSNHDIKDYVVKNANDSVETLTALMDLGLSLDPEMNQSEKWKASFRLIFNGVFDVITFGRKNIPDVSVDCKSFYLESVDDDVILTSLAMATNDGLYNNDEPSTIKMDINLISKTIH